MIIWKEQWNANIIHERKRGEEIVSANIDSAINSSYNQIIIKEMPKPRKICTVTFKVHRKVTL
jgi:hypothetical protein